MIKRKISRFFLGIGIIGLTLGFLGKIYWAFDLLAHFRVYFLVYFLLISIVLLAIRRFKEFFIALLFLGYCIISVSYFYIPVKDKIVNEKLKIVSINLLSHNENYQQVRDFIAIENPDVILFQEINEIWEAELTKSLETYPYQLMETRWDNFGIGMVSKEPGILELKDFGMAGVPSISLITQIDSQIIQVLGTHPLPPIGSDYTYLRNYQLNEVNEYLRQSPFETVLIGDLNTTSFSPNFKKLLSGTSLTDSRKGLGMQPSWSAMIPWLRITIDHALVTEKIVVVDRSLGPDIGSDHYPVILEIGISE